MYAADLKSGHVTIWFDTELPDRSWMSNMSRYYMMILSKHNFEPYYLTMKALQQIDEYNFPLQSYIQVNGKVPRFCDTYK